MVSVILSVCPRDFSKSYERILTIYLRSGFLEQRLSVSSVYFWFYSCSLYRKQLLIQGSIDNLSAVNAVPDRWVFTQA